MQTITYSDARQNLKQTIDAVCDNHSPVIITRQREGAAVLMSLEDYSALLETVYLLKSPKNAARLSKSISDVEAGKFSARKINLEN